MKECYKLGFFKVYELMVYELQLKIFYINTSLKLCICNCKPWSCRDKAGKTSQEYRPFYCISRKEHKYAKKTTVFVGFGID
jgi:hypothetical protein